MAAIISNSKFENIYSNLNGSISIVNVPINISCCSFVSNSCENYGGCICVLHTVISLNKTVFSKCFSKKRTNEIIGNAMYACKSKAELKEISTSQCGTSNFFSDSAIGIDYSKAITINYNSSSNYGIYGSSGIRYREPNEGSYVKFLQVYDSHDEFAVESYNNFITVSFSNFIHFTNKKYICWENTANIIKFAWCVFWDCDTQSFSYDCTSYLVENCVSNSFDNINKTSEATNNVILINLVCTIKVRHTAFRCRNSFLYGAYTFILICLS